MSAPLHSSPAPGDSVADFRVAGLHRAGIAPLQHASFTAAAGELTVLLSSDTSGQSLLRAAIGIDPVDAGVSELQGVTLSRRADRANTLTPQQVGVLTPTPYGFAGQTVFGALGQWLGGSRDEARVRCIAESLGLTDVGEVLVERLPLALQHRIGVGRALAPAPAMIAAENPFEELPERDQRMLEGVLRVIAADHGLPVLHASGAASSATRAHRVIRVAGGRVTADVRGWSEIQRMLADA